MIRLILIAIFLLLFMTIGQLGIIISFIISFFDKEKQKIFDYKYIYFIIKTILFLSGTEIQIYNEQNLDVLNNNNVLIVSNHRSDFDIVVGHTIINKPISYISKIEISKVPIISYWANKIDVLFLDRDNLRQSMGVILNAINYINKGKNVWIFPEGTRNKNENPKELLDFKEGSMSIAKKTDCYILPIAFYNTDDIFEKHKPFIIKTKIKINIGKKLKFTEIDESNKEQLGKYIENIIKSMIDEMA